MKVEDKSNEITAIYGLMDQLFLKGSIVTTDALNTQKSTVAKIIEKEAHYVLPVKENH
jgi:predicted transposase YbfD/YdcC